ncbi:MAG TPA: hypothetical protein ENI64_04660 [Gammaproteobacteria bacterium]|nr:hypothetical protein [Gammaproteobacteria bacterium]
MAQDNTAHSADQDAAGISGLQGSPLSSRPIDSTQLANLKFIEQCLYEYWSLGKNLAVGWCPVEKGILVLMIPQYALASYATENSPDDDEVLHGTGALLSDVAMESMAQQLVTGSKQRSIEDIMWIAKLFDVSVNHIQLPYPLVPDDTVYLIIEELMKRHGITFVESRAVALFDIVGFSLYKPLEQVTQINSLAYSLNSAHNKMLSKEIDVNFARLTTGDGFYIWNRDTSLQASTNLYHFMHLVLADNAIARSKSKGNTTPLLRTGFHIGSHYEFYPAEGLNPAVYSYIVGDVTVELARIVDQTQAGQVSVAEFQARFPDPQGRTGKFVNLSTVEFIKRAQRDLTELHGVELSGEHIKSIQCYLTGDIQHDGNYNIRKFKVTDKHGLSRNVYNAKVNIYCDQGAPIFLGIQESEVVH